MMISPAMLGPTMREALKEAEPNAMAEDRSCRETRALTMASRAGWPRDSADPARKATTSKSSTVTRSAMTSAPSMPANERTSTRLMRINRMMPKRSAMAPAKIVSTAVGTRSAKATAPSQTVEWVRSQASQPIDMRYIHRPTLAMNWPRK